MNRVQETSVVRPPAAARRASAAVRRRSTEEPPLAALPADDYRRLLPHLKTVPIRHKQVVHKEGDRIQRVYFPNGGVFSVTTPLSDGRNVEVATIGDEGMLGVETSLTDHAVATGDTMMQVPDGEVTMLPVEVFRHEVDGAVSYTTSSDATPKS